ncbi:rod-determining factor RdfA [Salinibaculum rarum]|uniref:rod-determining factor RdfA n=1 Tax=Salinibaculum rarum TaxID=3058903 RepID=UPI00265FBB55|nr:rod-determining factor RdfA [Salinibaculum sp. KK48]
MADPDTGGETPCSCKVSTVATDCGLDDVHAELRQAWERSDGKSVRELAAEFNRRVLSAAFADAGRLPIDGELDNLYRVLTDDDVDEGSRTRAREQLRQDGIDVEAVEERFISHQTLYRHLVNCLDADQETATRTDAERIETWETRLRALQNRTENVISQAISQLRNSETIEIGSYDVLLDVNVLCEDCGTFYTLSEFLDERACECQNPSDEE